jgi:hypothetical protein
VIAALLLAVVSRYPAGVHHARIAAEYAGTAPFIRVTVQGSARPLWFTIDSGSPYTFIDQHVAKELGLHMHKAAPINGAGSGSVNVQGVDRVTFEMPGFTTSGHEVRVADLSGLPALFDHPIDGFFGYDLLASSVVSMNPRLRMITFTDPARFHYTGRGVSLPIRFGGKSGKWIFVPGRIKVAGNREADTELMVDSGSTDAVNHPLLRKSTAPLRQINTGNGLGSPLPGVAGDVEWIRLGGYTLRGLPASCCGAVIDRLIGQGVLSQFVTTFDYARKRLILER